MSGDLDHRQIGPFVLADHLAGIGLFIGKGDLDLVRAAHHVFVASGGRDARVHSIPLKPYSQYIVTLTPEMLQCGENRLAVSLSKGEPELFGTIELVELELFLDY